ncbi:MAG: hypothetical protein WD873_05470 [Candidatus Hydrogenedentales bacterium]
MATLSQQRCFLHAGREAVARCPRCERYYCRECITEHEGRIVCAACMREVAAASPASPRANFLAPFFQFTTGMLVLVFAFMIVARLLLLLPHDYHEGTVWKESVWEEEEQ